jgi:hypothetical protein
MKPIFVIISLLITFSIIYSCSGKSEGSDTTQINDTVNAKDANMTDTSASDTSPKEITPVPDTAQEANTDISVSCDPLNTCQMISELKCDGKTVLKCDLDGSCLYWKKVKDCDVTEECKAGDCVKQSAGGTCKDIVQCLEDNQCSTSECMNNCIAKGDQNAQDVFNTMGDCVATNCASYQDLPVSQTACIYEKCKSQYEGCNGPVPAGNKSCYNVLNCLSGCGSSDQACMQQCMSNGTFDAQLKFLKLTACVEQKCAGITDTAQLQQCLTSKCSTEVSACKGYGM